VAGWKGVLLSHIHHKNDILNERFKKTKKRQRTAHLVSVFIEECERDCRWRET